MSDSRPGWSRTRWQDASPAVAARERGRSRVRAVTAVAGAASLATAGLVAFTLPGAAHAHTASGAGVSAGSQGGQPGGDDDSSGDDGSLPATGVQQSPPAPSAGSGTVHAASGAS
jgi:hypothetical protein